MNQEIYSADNFKGLASLLLRTWGPDEALRRARFLARRNRRALEFVTVVGEATER